MKPTTETEAENLPARLDVIAAAIPQNIPIQSSTIAAEIVRFRDEAEKAVAVADRAVIDCAQAMGNAADVIRAINASSKKLTTARYNRLEHIDSIRQSIANMYLVAGTQYALAKTRLEGKVRIWRQAEEKRVIAESNERKQIRAERAKQLAAAQLALGDAAGATQILEEAAAVPDVAPRVEAVGVYGGKMSVTNRNVGKVTDVRLFLGALATSKCDYMSAILERIELPVSLLNKLAAAVQAGEALCPPGFLADVDSKDVAR